MRGWSTQKISGRVLRGSEGMGCLELKCGTMLGRLINDGCVRPVSVKMALIDILRGAARETARTIQKLSSSRFVVLIGQ